VNNNQKERKPESELSPFEDKRLIPLFSTLRFFLEIKTCIRIYPWHIKVIRIISSSLLFFLVLKNKVMKMFYLGIDVSKEKLDLCLSTESKVLVELVVKNDMKTIKKSLSLLLSEYLIERERLLVCAEYTGHYTYPLCCVCE